MREDEENIVVLIVDDNHKVRVRLRLLWRRPVTPSSRRRTV